MIDSFAYLDQWPTAPPPPPGPFVTLGASTTTIMDSTGATKGGSACGYDGCAWVVSAWGACNVTCGLGFVNRYVVCRTRSGVGVPVADDACGLIAPPPLRVSPCEVPCPGYLCHGFFASPCGPGISTSQAGPTLPEPPSTCSPGDQADTCTPACNAPITYWTAPQFPSVPSTAHIAPMLAPNATFGLRIDTATSLRNPVVVVVVHAPSNPLAVLAAHPPCTVTVTAPDLQCNPGSWRWAPQSGLADGLITAQPPVMDITTEPGSPMWLLLQTAPLPAPIPNLPSSYAASTPESSLAQVELSLPYSISVFPYELILPYTIFEYNISGPLGTVKRWNAGLQFDASPAFLGFVLTVTTNTTVVPPNTSIAMFVNPLSLGWPDTSTTAPSPPLWSAIYPSTGYDGSSGASKSAGVLLMIQALNFGFSATPQLFDYTTETPTSTRSRSPPR